MRPRWTTLGGIFLAAVLGAAVGLVGWQHAQVVWAHVSADHQAIHELAVLEMQRQRAAAGQAPAPATFDPAPSIQSK